MKSNRNSYLVSKALKGFVLASILTSAAGQLASTIDAIVLAQFEGAEAVSALNLVLPVTMLISCLGLLMCFGANALMARFIGHHDLKSAQAIFSTAIWSVLTLGVTFSLLMYAGIPAVLRAIANESGLRELAKEYLGTYVLGAWLEMLSYALCLFVATDGHPRRVTLSVSMGVVVNIVVDVLAVGWFEWGIRGIALGTLAQYAVNVALLGLYLRHPSCSYRLLWPGGGLRRLFVKNVAEGAPMTISNVLMAVTLLLINNIILGTQGERGLFFWTICLQTLLVAMVLVNGVMEALVAIGGVMMGEHDVGGFSLLARKGLATAGGLVALAMVPLWVPDAVGMAFGMEDAGELAALNETFGEAIPRVLLGVLRMMVSRGHVRQLESMAREYRELAMEASGESMAEVTSAVPLKEAEAVALRTRLEKKFNRRVILRCRVDPSLIGGIRVEIDVRVIDGSIRNKLQEIK